MRNKVVFPGEGEIPAGVVKLAFGLHKRLRKIEPSWTNWRTSRRRKMYMKFGKMWVFVQAIRLSFSEHVFVFQQS